VDQGYQTPTALGIVRCAPAITSRNDIGIYKDEILYFYWLREWCDGVHLVY